MTLGYTHMPRELLHIYGPFSVCSYGLTIAVALLAFCWLVLRHPGRKKIVSESMFINILLVGVITGIVGGRLMYILFETPKPQNLIEFFDVWQGGLSILGTIIAIILFMPWYLHRHKIPVLRFFDLITIHAGLLQGISRLGCYFAGCCFGAPTTMSWATYYSCPDSIAPVGIPLHPTQLYSAALLFIIFLFMYGIAQRFFKKPGQCTALYLALVSMARFVVDFWRGDRIFNKLMPAFSEYQYAALGLLLISCIFFAWFTLRPTKQSS